MGAAPSLVRQLPVSGATDRTKVGLLAAVTCLALLDGVNGSMSSTLRPYLMGSFAVTPDQITWTAILYFAAKLYALLLAARVQERFGQRSALLGASASLVLTTAASVLVVTFPSLLVVRFVQGLSGGLMLALGQGALLAAFPRQEQPTVQGVFALAAVMFPATMVPALLGGYAYNSAWQYAYGLLALCGVFGCGWLFWRRDALENVTDAGPVPVARIGMLATALLATVYVLIQGDRYAWLESPYIVWPILLVAACALGLVFAETRGGPTYLRYGCFRLADFTFGISVSVLAGIALFGGGFAIPGFTGGVLRYPAWQSGLVQLYASIGATFSLIGVALALRFTRTPALPFLAAGLILLCTAMWKLGEAPSNAAFDDLVPWLMARGVAVGCLFLPLTLMTLTAVPPTWGVAAAGIFNFGRQLGALAGVAWMQTLLEHLTARNQTVMGEALSLSSPNAVAYVHAAQSALALHGAQSPAAAIAFMVQDAHRQFATLAFNGCFQALAMLFAYSLPLVLISRVLTARLLKAPAA